MTDTLSEAPPVEPDTDEPEQPEPDTAEQPEPDSDEPEQGTDEAPAEPAPGTPTEKELEAAGKALDKEAQRHTSAISRIMGDDALLLHVCPRCIPNIQGFIWPPDQVQPLPEQKAAVKLSLGEGADLIYRQSDAAAECPKCAGLGKVLTGSHVRGAEHVKCLECDGRGWIGSLAHQLAAVGEKVVQASENGNEAPAEPAPMTDPWGRVQGDPLFGVLPGFEH